MRRRRVAVSVLPLRAIRPSGVSVYDKTGKLIQTIPVPEAPANMCFGGKDMQTLFITARTGFYSVRMAVKGVGA